MAKKKEDGAMTTVSVKTYLRRRLYQIKGEEDYANVNDIIEEALKKAKMW